MTDKFIKSIVNSYGIKVLNALQMKAIQGGLLDDKNILINIPTGAGKTILAQIAMSKKINEGKKVIYLAPYRSIALEKSTEFNKHNFGNKIVTSIGGDKRRELPDFDVLITTSEKLNALMQKNPTWINKIGLIIVDEAHEISTTRGSLTESIITYYLQRARIMLMSATIGNADEIAKWINGNLVVGTERPIELNEVILTNDKIYNTDSMKQKKSLFSRIINKIFNMTVKPVGTNHKMEQPFYDTIKNTYNDNRGQILVFNQSKNLTEKRAIEIQKKLKEDNFYTEEELEKFKVISKRITKIGNDPISKKMAETIKYGVGFHHSALSQKMKTEIEQLYKKKEIPIISSTPTLATGVNLPTRTVIIADIKRYDPQTTQNEFISTMEYKQMIGRAGRKNLDPYGNAVINIDGNYTNTDISILLDKYLNGEPEEMQSHYNKKFEFHILQYISYNIITSYNDIKNHVKKTLYAYQNEVKDNYIIDTLKKLASDGLIISTNVDNINYIKTTELGMVSTRMNLEPHKIRKFNDFATEFDKSQNLNEISILHMIATLRPQSYIKSNNDNNVDVFLQQNTKFIVNKKDITKESVKLVMVLHEWINEVEPNEIIKKYDLMPSQLMDITKNLKWLLIALKMITRNTMFLLNNIFNTFITRIQYGIKPELVPYFKCEGITKTMARELYDGGISPQTYNTHKS